MSDWTGRYGTVVKSIVAGGLVLAGSLYEYATHRQVYPEDIALLWEAKGERENVAGGITSSNTLGLQVYADQDVKAIDAAIEAVCPKYVNENVGDGGWDSSSYSYTMFTWDSLQAAARMTGESNDWLVIGVHIYANDLKKRYRMLYQLKSTVVSSTWGSGTKCSWSASDSGSWSTNAVEDHGTIASVPWQTDCAPCDESKSCEEKGASIFDGPPWSLGPWSYSISLSVPAEAGESCTESDGVAPYGQWSASGTATRSAGESAAGVCFFGNGLWSTRWVSDSHSYSATITAEQQKTAYQAPVPARQIPIDGSALFHFCDDALDPVPYGSNATSVSSAQIAPPVPGGTFNMSGSIDMDDEFTCSANGDNYRYIQKGVKDPATRTETASGYNTNSCSPAPTKLTWNFVYCASLD